MTSYEKVRGKLFCVGSRLFPSTVRVEPGIFICKKFVRREFLRTVNAVHVKGREQVDQTKQLKLEDWTRLRKSNKLGKRASAAKISPLKRKNRQSRAFVFAIDL